MEANGAVKCRVSLGLLRLAQMNWVAEYQTEWKELEEDVQSPPATIAYGGMLCICLGFWLNLAFDKN